MATDSSEEGRIANFAAGPAVLPLEVLKKVQAELLNYDGNGLSVMEMSHRSAQFGQIIEEARQDMRTLLNIPDNYEVLFAQGGATTQFSSIPYNLLGEGDTVADYVITGNWSKKCYDEINKVYPGRVNLAFSNFDTTPQSTSIAPVSEWNLTPGARYLHVCINETVHGNTMREFPEVDCPIVADFSSCFLSEPIDVSKFGVVYGGAQKNIGPAGVTVVIVRKDLLGNADPRCPTLSDWSILAKKGSMYNTPPTFSIYVMGQVFKWLLGRGGLEATRDYNIAKAKLVYDAAEAFPDFYVIPVDKPIRSLMNIRLNINDAVKNNRSVKARAAKSAEELAAENGTLESDFVAEAAAIGLMSLKGYRTLGGIRASCYNAQTMENCQKLADFMRAFAAENSA